MTTIKIFSGHEAEIAALDHNAAEWEINPIAQLHHIVSSAQNEIDNRSATHDFFGEPNTKTISEMTLRDIEVCIARIRAINK